MKNASYSRLDKYEQCPFAYKIQYEDGVQISASSIALAFGTATHQCEEKIANDIIANKPINYAKYSQEYLNAMKTIEEQFFVDYNSYDKSGTTYRDKAYRYLNTGIYRLENFLKAHPTYKLIASEAAFSDILIGDSTFRGAIDRVLLDTATGNYILHDIKTWSVPKEQKELATPLQFVIYAEAAKVLFGADPEKIVCVYDLPCCETMQEAGTKGWLKRGKEKLEKIFNAIEQKDFRPKQSPLCAWCPFSKSNPDAKFPEKFLCPYSCYWNRDTRKKEDINLRDFEFTTVEDYPRILESYLKKQGISGTKDEFLQYIHKK